MLVSICTTKETVMTTLVSMVANYGCKFTKLRTFNYEDIKCSDICILDLDNLKEFHDNIKKDINVLNEIIIIGISSSDEILNEFKDYFNIEKKPFNSKTFISYKEKIKEEYNSEFTINKDSDLIYNKLGIKKSDLLNADNLSSETLIDTLRHKINKQESILSEDDYFKSLDIGEISIPDTKAKRKQKIVDNNIVKYEDKALEKYRLYKLKSLNLSPFEIEQQLNILKVARDEKKANERKNKNEQHRNNLLEKLKSGELVNKNKHAEEPKLKINKNVENKKQLSPEEIYNQNKNKEKENIEVKIKIDNTSIADKEKNTVSVLPEKKNNSISNAEKEVKTTKINRDLSEEEDLLSNYNKQKQTKKKDTKLIDDEQIKETSKIQSPISKTSDNDLFKTKRPDLNEENEKSEKPKKKKDYSSILEKEKKLEEEQKTKNNISILDINISKEQEEEIKNKIQNLRKYKRTTSKETVKSQEEIITESTNKNNTINNIENTEDKIQENITNNHIEKKLNVTEKYVEDKTEEIIFTKEKTIIDENTQKNNDIINTNNTDTSQQEYIEEIISKEPEHIIKTTTTKQETPKFTKQKKQEEIIEKQKTENTDVESNPEKESEYQKLYEAIHRLDGSNSNNKTSSTNNNNNNAVKNIKAELPTKSLFDLIKEKNKDITIVDFKEQRKNAIDKIVKPPKR